jgi:cytochrome c peroxidase
MQDGSERRCVTIRSRVAALAFWTVAGAAGCAGPADALDVREPSIPRVSTATAEDPVEPLARLDLDPRRVRLGERMFFDKRVSGDGSVSCETCHLVTKGGGDGVTHPHVETRPEHELNTPTVYNLAYDFRYNWSGRFDDLGAQLDVNLKNPKTMASNWPHVLRKLSADPTYVREFAAAYPGGLTTENARDALVLYELSLVTPDSRFDRWLRGEPDALDETERQGYELFKRYGCISCHQGANVGGNMLERFGVMRDYFADRGTLVESDFGRFTVTKDEKDKFVFRVPSLRNVEKTAPYFHDGSAKTLSDAVKTMASLQSGKELKDSEVSAIVAFLDTLTGEIPKDFVKQPELPKSGPKTPKPDPK